MNTETPPNTSPLEKIRLNIPDTTAIVCPCGCQVFSSGGMLLRRVPARLMQGRPGPNIAEPIPAVYCVGCGKAMEELLPEELRSPVEV